MGQHTTNEVYDKLTDVEQKLDNNAKSTVTTTHFDTKVSELKKAIQDGGKKKEEDEKQKWEDLVRTCLPSRNSWPWQREAIFSVDSSSWSPPVQRPSHSSPASRQRSNP